MKRRVELALSTNAFKRYSVEQAIRMIADVGYRGVEIMCDIPHAYPPALGEQEVESIKNTVSESGLMISNLNAFTLFAVGDTYHPSWIEDSQEERQVRIQHTIDCINLAAELGAQNISIEPGGPAASPRNDKYKLFAAGLSIASRVAAEKKVKILVEPEPGLLLQSSAEFCEFMQIVSSDSVGLNFDIGHFYCVGEDPAELVYKLADHIVHFHLADIAGRVHNHLIPGMGEIDFPSVFDAIDSIGYNGFVTVELYPYQDNPMYAAEEAYKNIQTILSGR